MDECPGKKYVQICLKSFAFVIVCAGSKFNDNFITDAKLQDKLFNFLQVCAKNKNGRAVCF